MPYNVVLVSAEARREPVLCIHMSPPSGGLPLLTTPPHPLGQLRAPALRNSLPPALCFTRGGVSRLACFSPAFAAACSELAGASETPGLKPPGSNETLVSQQLVLSVSLHLTLSCACFLRLLKSCLSQVQLLN